MVDTLRSLIERHPEWADLPLTVARPDGNGVDYIGAAGLVYESVDDGDRVLVFSPN